jgi:GNAT superfamily N-acetyltransferase
MPVVYFKRFRMQIDLARIESKIIPSDTAIRYIPWSDKYLGHHSTAKWEAFRYEIDANVFPCLGDRDGCRQLMRDISLRDTFVPEATWLAAAITEDAIEIPVGTIQGLRLNVHDGAIQNVGVTPAYRGQGIAKRLLMLALHGFRDVGCKRVNLEVTIHNSNAIRLYESIGFQYLETVYKVGNVPISS